MRSIQACDRRSTRTIALVLSALILSGCHSRVPIVVPGSTPPAAVFTELKAEDKVRVTLQNGNMAEFVIAEVQAAALVAQDGRRFAYADIARLEKTRVSKGKTIALTAGLIGVGLLMAWLALAVAFASVVGST